jgi:hypothetical protein
MRSAAARATLARRASRPHRCRRRRHRRDRHPQSACGPDPSPSHPRWPPRPSLEMDPTPTSVSTPIDRWRAARPHFHRRIRAGEGFVGQAGICGDAQRVCKASLGRTILGQQGPSLEDVGLCDRRILAQDVVRQQLRRPMTPGSDERPSERQAEPSVGRSGLDRCSILRDGFVEPTAIGQTLGEHGAQAGIVWCNRQGRPQALDRRIVHDLIRSTANRGHTSARRRSCAL